MNPKVEFKSMLAAVKAVGDGEGNGGFEAILSTSAVDRDGETIAPGAFDPLPASIPIYHQHDWVDKSLPIGRGEPYYDGETLKIKGVFGSSDKAQEVRRAVNEGLIDAMSVGYLVGKKSGPRSKPVVTKGDLFESSFTGIPINPTASVLASKAVEIKAGARNSSSDAERLQQIHDLAVDNGADCGAMKSLTTKAIDGSYEDLQEDLAEAVVSANRDKLAALYPEANQGDYQWYVTIIATFPDRVIYSIEQSDPDGGFQATYTVSDDGETITLGAPEAVEIDQVVKPSTEAMPPAAGAAPTAKAVGAAPADPSLTDELGALRETYALLAAT